MFPQSPSFHLSLPSPKVTTVLSSVMSSSTCGSQRSKTAFQLTTHPGVQAPVPDPALESGLILTLAFDP